jgi:hypothetical protein
MYIYIAVAVVVFIAAKVICSLAVFPGQLFAKTETLDDSLLNDKELEITFFQETTRYQRVVNAIKIANEESDKTIIIFNGQNATIKNNKKIQTYRQLAKDSGCTVIGFDYGGTGSMRISTWSYHVLVDDSLHLVKSVFNNLQKKGPIILKGNSLGGAISTRVARLCHEQSMPVFLGNGRSFKSVSAVIAGYIQTFRVSGHYENRFTKTLALFIKPIASGFLTINQFELNVIADYEAIPAAYKYYYIVRSDKEEREFKKDDLTIPHCATLESEPKITQSIKKSLASATELTPTDIEYYWKHRKVTSLSPNNAHATPENVLFCRNDRTLSAYDLFCIFSKDYVGKESVKTKQSSLAMDVKFSCL